jgi:hypothetical protein
MNQLLPIVASSPLPALVAAAGERASIRVLEFFAASGAGAAAPLRQIHRARSERSGRNYFTAAMISPPALCRAPRPRLVHRRRRKSRGFLRGLHLQACRRGCDQGHAVASIRAMPAKRAPSLLPALRPMPPTDDTPRKPRRRPRSGENMAGRLMHPGSTRGARSGGCRPSTPNPPSPERALRAELFYRGNDFATRTAPIATRFPAPARRSSRAR